VFSSAGEWEPLICPDFCECYNAPGTDGPVTDCSNVEPKLGRVPFERIDKGVRTLNMSGGMENGVELVFADESQLKVLDVSNNGIEQIGIAAFAGLRQLQYIDMSRNFMFGIHPDAFA